MQASSRGPQYLGQRACSGGQRTGSSGPRRPSRWHGRRRRDKRVAPSGPSSTDLTPCVTTARANNRVPVRRRLEASDARLRAGQPTRQGLHAGNGADARKSTRARRPTPDDCQDRRGPGTQLSSEAAIAAGQQAMRDGVVILQASQGTGLGSRRMEGRSTRSLARRSIAPAGSCRTSGAGTAEESLQH